MSILFGTAHSESRARLHAIESQSRSEERLSAFRKFVKVELRRLQIRHRSGADGVQVAAWRSHMIDVLLQRVAELAAPESSAWDSLSLVALGGYGRAELAPHSDVDLLILYRKRKNQFQALTQEILYTLWDSGLQVGHSVRTIDECVSMSRKDLSSLNALIDARPIFGSEALYRELCDKLQRAVYGYKPARHIESLLESRKLRYARYGEAVSLQEPNVKETAGGLRDLHTLLWASRLGLGCSSLAALQATNELTGREVASLHKAHAHLLRIRNEMHFSTGRRTDTLSLDLQEKIAGPLGYANRSYARASEVLMRDYYRQARHLHVTCSAFLEKVSRRLNPPSRWSRPVAVGAGLVVRDGALNFAEEGYVPVVEAANLMQIFRRAQASKARLAESLQQAIRRRLAGVNRQVRTSRQNAEMFLGILSQTGSVGTTLRQMHEVEWLGKYLPEFGRISCLVQHDLYHRYTIDEHTLRALENLDELFSSNNPRLAPYRQVYARIKKPAILHLAALLHDVGKGLGSGHGERGAALARRVCQRLALEPESTARLEFLVRHHLSMGHVSQRRDISDPTVIRNFVEHVGGQDLLDMLLLLTYADISAINPEAWNEWKSALLLDLYERASQLFERGNGGDAEDLAAREAEILTILEGQVDPAQVRAHLRQLNLEYARATSSETLVNQIRLVDRLGRKPLQTLWRLDPISESTELTVCTRDRRGLFAAIAGTLASQGVTILSAQLNTRADGIVLDTFRVRQIDGTPVSGSERWAELDAALETGVRGKLDLSVLVLRRVQQEAGRFRKSKMSREEGVRIAWDHDASSTSTILEIQAPDRLGLAYTISSTLAELGLDIVFAKMATIKHRALDIFYIVDGNHQKLRPEECRAVEQRLIQALASAKGET